MYKRTFLKRAWAVLLSMGFMAVIGSQKDAKLMQNDIAFAPSGVTDWGNCRLGDLFECLEEGGAGHPYAYARILITVDTQGGEDAKAMQDLDGTARISWQTFQTAEAFQLHFSEQEHFAQEDGILPQECAAELVYYQYQLDADTCALDIGRFLKERYDNGEVPIHAVAISDVTSYCFSQSAVRQLVVKDRVIYGIECRSTADSMTEQDISGLLMAYSIQKQGAKDFSGWVMDEEDLYWFDHEERVTSLEDPTRSFLEVRGIDQTWNGARYMENFALLKEADYQVMLGADGPALQIHFEFAQDIPESGFQIYLLNGFCTSESYKMQVTDRDTGELLQEMDVAMSIEMPDMITFEDLDGDGYLDMTLDKPTHWNGERAVVDEFSRQSFMLWDPEERVFLVKRKQEIEQRREQGLQAKDVTYIVQSGDTLWGISRRFYGTGTRCTELQNVNADVLSGHKYLMPGMTLEIPGGMER